MLCYDAGPFSDDVLAAWPRPSHTWMYMGTYDVCDGPITVAVHAYKHTANRTYTFRDLRGITWQYRHGVFSYAQPR